MIERASLPTASDDNFAAASRYAMEETYAATRRPVEHASTLIPDAYRDANYHAEELIRLWARSWVCVGYECQVEQPGNVLVTHCGDQSILVTRDKSGVLHAFFNVCRHRGSQLLPADTHCSVIRCPYHSWGYSLKGDLLGAPYFQGHDVPPHAAERFRNRAEDQGAFCKDDHGLLPVRIERWGGMVFVNCDPSAACLTEWLGDLADRYPRHPLEELQLVRRKSYTIAANWKLVAENFIEYYHLPWVHPELCNVSGFENHHRCQGPGMYTGMCTSPWTPAPDVVRLDLPVFPELNSIERESIYFHLIFPNIALWIFPNHLVTLLLRPQQVGVTVESMDMLVHPSVLNGRDIDDRLDEMFAFWDMVNRQDIGIVEQVQSGLQTTAYTGGRMCFEFEEPVHRFQNMVIDRMLAIDRIAPGDRPLPPTQIAIPGTSESESDLRSTAL